MSETIRACILCRTQSGSGPTDEWHQLFPRGEFPDTEVIVAGKPRRVTFVVDDEALRRMLAARDEDARAANWVGYLVSQEHFAHLDEGSSAAHAWCPDLAAREDGLWGRYDKTPLGDESIGKVYRYRSPVADIEQIASGRYRPVRLIDIGLTNKPKFKTLAAARGRDGGDTHNAEETHMLERMRILLGAKDATEDQVFARVEQLCQAEKDGTKAAADLKVLQGEVLAREADAFVEEHKAVIADPVAVTAQYIAARDATRALFAGLKTTAAPAAGDRGGKGNDGKQRVLAREDARAPKGGVIAGDGGGDEAGKAEAHAARISARARELVATKVCGNLTQAYAQAQREVSAA